jgi:TusA-related sulfurtransferase
MNQLDFRGEECPGPLVKTIRVLSKMRVGEKLWY